MLCHFSGFRFCRELSREHVSNVYFTHELEEELADMNMKHQAMFHKDSDRELIMRSIDIQRIYPHSPGPTCSERGECIYKHDGLMCK